MAETLLRHMVQERGLARAIKVHSAGVAPFARDGALVSLDTRFALRDHGIELADGKTSTALKRNLHLLETADLVLAMTADQKAMWTKMIGQPFELKGGFGKGKKGGND